MKIFLKFLFVFLLLIQFSQEQAIREVNETTYNETLENNSFVLMLFYSSWAPNYMKIEEELKILSVFKNLPQNISFFKIEVTKSNHKIKRLYPCKSIPELKLFSKGVLVDSYSSLMKSELIADWILKRFEPSIIEILDKQSLQNFVNSHERSLLYFGKNLETFKELSNKYMDVFFIYSQNSELKEFYGHEILLFRGNKLVEFKGELNSSLFHAFLDRNRFDDVVVFSTKSKNFIFGSEIPVFYLFLNNDEPEEEEAILQSFTEFALKHANEFLPVLYNGFKDDMVGLFLQNIGVSETSMPCVRYTFVDEEKESTYFYQSSKFSTESFENFYEDIKSQKIKPKEKKLYEEEEKTVEESDLLVKRISKNELEGVISNKEKDVMVLFYDTSDICKKFERIYERAARSISANENILLVKFDVSKSGKTRFNIEDVPTVFFFVSKDKENPIEYTGDEKVKDFVNFIKENTSFNWVKEDL